MFKQFFKYFSTELEMIWYKSKLRKQLTQLNAFVQKKLPSIQVCLLIDKLPIEKSVLKCLDSF